MYQFIHRTETLIVLVQELTKYVLNKDYFTFLSLRYVIYFLFLEKHFEGRINAGRYNDA